MPISVSHQLSATTPDDPSYEIKPSNWNSAHAITLNLSGSDVINAFSNSNNITFGLAPGGQITASASYSQATFNQSIQTQNSVLINGSTGSIVFSNSNGITFGGVGSTITASYNSAAGGAAISALGSSQNSGTVVFANANGVSFGMTGGTITATVTAQAPVSAGISALQVSNTTYTSGVVTFQNANGLSFGSSGAGGISGSYTVPTTTNLAGNVLSVASTTGSAMVGTLNTSGLTLGVPNYLTTFTGAAGTNFSGYNATATMNSSGLTLSVGVGSAAGTAGIYGQGNTTGQSSSSSYNMSSLPIAGGGIISVGNSAGSLQISAPNPVVLSQMSMGISGGNTQGNTGTVAQGQVVFAGGNNVTLSGSTNGSNMTVTVIGGAGANVNFSAGTTSGNLGSVVFSNSNGVSFGLNGSTITASAAGGGGGGIYAGVSNLGNFAGSTGTVSTGNVVFAAYGAVSLSQSTGAAGSAATISISAPATSSLVGGANITVSTAGSTITIIGASAAPAPIAISGGTTSGSLSSIVFTNANNVSFQLNGSTMSGSIATTYAGTGFTSTTTAGSVLVGTHNTAGLSLGVPNWITAGGGGGVAVSAAGSSQNAGTVVWSNSNNVSFGMNGSTITASVGGVAGGVGISAAGSSQTTGNIVFSNSNGISFGMNGSTVTGSIATTYAGTGFTSTTTGGSVLLGTHNTAGLSLGVPNWITTYNSQANFSAGVSFLGNNAGSTGMTGSQIVLVGSGPISLSQSTGAAGATISILAPATSSISGTGAVSISVNGSTISIGAANQSTQPVAISGSNGSFAFSTLTMGNSNNISFYSTNGSVVASANLAGTGFSSGTTSGLSSGTLNSLGLSAVVPYLTRFALNGSLIRNLYSGTQIVSSAMASMGYASYNYMSLHIPVTGTRVDGLGYLVGDTVNSTRGINMGYSVWGAIYTRNGSTLSQLSSGSTNTTYGWTSNTTGATWISQVAIRPLSIPMNVNVPPGEYFVAFNASSSIAPLGGTTITTDVNMSVYDFGGAIGVFNATIGGAYSYTSTIGYADMGSVTSSSSNWYYGAGIATAASAGLPSSVAISNLNQSNIPANIIIFRNA